MNSLTMTYFKELMQKRRNPNVYTLGLHHFCINLDYGLDLLDLDLPVCAVVGCGQTAIEALDVP